MGLDENFDYFPTISDSDVMRAAGGLIQHQVKAWWLLVYSPVCFQKLIPPASEKIKQCRQVIDYILRDLFSDHLQVII